MLEHLAGNTTRFATDRPTAFSWAKGPTALAQAKGAIERAVPEVLFACEQNAGRFTMAAGVTNVPSSGSSHVRSAGSTQAQDRIVCSSRRWEGLGWISERRSRHRWRMMLSGPPMPSSRRVAGMHEPFIRLMLIRISEISIGRSMLRVNSPGNHNVDAAQRGYYCRSEAGG